MQWAQDFFLSVTVIMFCIVEVCATVLPTRKISCRFQQADALQCAREHDVFQMPDESSSYGFGFGSVDDVEVMCKKKWHILVQECVGDRVIRRCHEQGASEFQLSMWRFIFDPRPHVKAAFYLCHPHNLNIFRAHRDSCLKSHEIAAQTCAKRQLKELAKYTSNMAERTEEDASQDSSSSADYASFIKRQLSTAYCETNLEKIRCLTTLLQSNCSLDVVHLIQNYFRELLPPGCHFYPKLLSKQSINSEKTFQVEQLTGGESNDYPISSSFLLNDGNNQDDIVEGGIGGSSSGHLRGWRDSESTKKGQRKETKFNCSSQLFIFTSLTTFLIECISLLMQLS